MVFANYFKEFLRIKIYRYFKQENVIIIGKNTLKDVMKTFIDMEETFPKFQCNAVVNLSSGNPTFIFRNFLKKNQSKIIGYKNNINVFSEIFRH